jgi:hypothetical protein
VEKRGTVEVSALSARNNSFVSRDAVDFDITRHLESGGFLKASLAA